MKKANLYITLFLFGQVALGQSTPISIDTIVTTSIGGILQVVKLKGKDITKPILLYLHGASGNNFL